MSEYAGTATQLDPRNYEGLQNSVAPRVDRTDLASVRNRLEECLRRASDISAGVRVLADSILGTRPEVASGDRAERPVESSLSQLVDDLGVAIARIESNLNRL